MKRSMIGRMTVGVAVAAASFVVAVGSAAAETSRPDDRATHGAGAVVLENLEGVTRPDDRATHGPGSLAAVTFVESASVGGFDWVDAGIGAATALGLALVGVGLFVLVASHRRGPAFS
jgi:hypothetical protein